MRDHLLLGGVGIGRSTYKRFQVLEKDEQVHWVSERERIKVFIIRVTAFPDNVETLFVSLLRKWRSDPTQVSLRLLVFSFTDVVKCGEAKVAQHEINKGSPAEDEDPKQHTAGAGHNQFPARCLPDSRNNRERKEGIACLGGTGRDGKVHRRQMAAFR